jgi:cyclophilin family peptidyl-prolyl cis-trans isomerase
MTSESGNTLTLTLKAGDVKVALRPDLAPMHVARIKELANQGFYDGVTFHRVIPGFMAQTGDPTGTGSGGSKLGNLKAEFTPERHVRGTLSMARTSAPDSANSQFFICFADAPWLDRQYTVFGKVVSGMEHVDAIKKGGQHNNGAISGEPDRILKARVSAE